MRFPNLSRLALTGADEGGDEDEGEGADDLDYPHPYHEQPGQLGLQWLMEEEEEKRTDEDRDRDRRASDRDWRRTAPEREAEMERQRAARQAARLSERERRNRAREAARRAARARADREAFEVSQRPMNDALDDLLNDDDPPPLRRVPWRPGPDAPAPAPAPGASSTLHGGDHLGPPSAVVVDDDDTEHDSDATQAPEDDADSVPAPAAAPALEPVMPRPAPPASEWRKVANRERVEPNYGRRMLPGTVAQNTETKQQRDARLRSDFFNDAKRKRAEEQVANGVVRVELLLTRAESGEVERSAPAQALNQLLADFLYLLANPAVRSYLVFRMSNNRKTGEAWRGLADRLLVLAGTLRAKGYAVRALLLQRLEQLIQSDVLCEANKRHFGSGVRRTGTNKELVELTEWYEAHIGPLPGSGEEEGEEEGDDANLALHGDED